MVSLGVKSLQDENFGIERPFGVRLQLHQLVAIIQRLEKERFHKRQDLILR
jgi:hypothetical protein